VRSATPLKSNAAMNIKVDSARIKNFDTSPEDVGRKVETCRGRVTRIIIKLDTVRLVVSYFNTFEQYLQVQGFCKLFLKFKNLVNVRTENYILPGRKICYLNALVCRTSEHVKRLEETKTYSTKKQIYVTTVTNL
jgi:hypothetical protein